MNFEKALSRVIFDEVHHSQFMIFIRLLNVVFNKTTHPHHTRGPTSLPSSFLHTYTRTTILYAVLCPEIFPESEYAPEVERDTFY